MATDDKNVGTQGGKAEGTEKKGLLTRMYDGYQKVMIKMKSTKGGRAVIKISKGAAIGLGLYGSYRLGQKSVKPVTVYVTEGVQEEEPEVEETEVEETNTEDSEQEQE